MAKRLQYRISLHFAGAASCHALVLAADAGHAIDLAYARYSVDLATRKLTHATVSNVTSHALDSAMHGATGNLDAESFDPPSANAIQVAGRQFSGGAA